MVRSLPPRFLPERSTRKEGSWRAADTREAAACKSGSTWQGREARIKPAAAQTSFYVSPYHHSIITFPTGTPWEEEPQWTGLRRTMVSRELWVVAQGTAGVANRPWQKRKDGPLKGYDFWGTARTRYSRLLPAGPPTSCVSQPSSPPSSSLLLPPCSAR